MFSVNERLFKDFNVNRGQQRVLSISHLQCADDSHTSPEPAACQIKYLRLILNVSRLSKRLHVNWVQKKINYYQSTQCKIYKAWQLFLTVEQKSISQNLYIRRWWKDVKRDYPTGRNNTFL